MMDVEGRDIILSNIEITSYHSQSTGLKAYLCGYCLQNLLCIQQVVGMPGARRFTI
jgi:hypothetical protein